MFTSDHKPCSQCKQVFPLTDDYWYKDKRHSDGYQSRCKKCDNKSGKEHYRKNKDKILDQHREYNIRNSDKVKEYQKEYRANNADSIKQQQKEYRTNNPEKVSADKKKWSTENRERKRQINRRWRRNNIEKAREIARNYVRNNPKKILLHVNRRRARKAKAEGSHTIEQIVSLFREQSGYCFHCGVDLIPIGYEADHWIPLSRGGSDDIGNIRLLCMPCNRSKGYKLPHEWNSKYPQ